jgi:hypothetical protein
MSTSAFDTIVSSLNETERLTLLNKLHAAEKKETIPLETPGGKLSDIGEVSASEKFQSEPFLLRLILFIKSLFKNASVTELYNAHRLKEIAQKIEKNFPRILDLRMNALSDRMYEKIYGLKKASDFFLDSISYIQNDAGGFYMFLGTFFIPELSEHFDTEINPIKIELSNKLSSETKVSLQHKLDDLLTSIPPAKKSSLYGIIQSVDWLAQFCALPFLQFLHKFGKGDGPKICPIQDARSDINEFARLLCHGKLISNALIEAVSVYAVLEKQSSKKENAQAKQQQDEFILNAIVQLEEIKMFMDEVPLRALGALAHNSIDWSPPFPQGSEDWYFKFKNRWKKYLDSLWTTRIVKKQKADIIFQLKETFNLTSLPLLPVRPWSTLWEGIVFEHEYTMGFLNFFFKNLYPIYEPVITTLVIEGVFIKKENGIQLSDLMHNFETEAENLEFFLSSLADSGAFGSIFIKAGSPSSPNQQRINSAMQRLTAEASTLVGNFSSYCPQFIEVFRGIVGDSKNPRYDTISNLNVIQGTENEEFKQKILAVRRGIDKYFEFFGRIQMIPVGFDDASTSEIEEELQRMETKSIDSLLFPQKKESSPRARV